MVVCEKIDECQVSIANNHDCIEMGRGLGFPPKVYVCINGYTDKLWTYEMLSVFFKRK